MLSEATLKRRFGTESEQVAAEFRAQGAELERLREISFAQGSASGTATLAVRQFLLRRGIDLQIALQSDSFDVQAELCRSGDYAALCPRFYLGRLIGGDGRGGSPLLAFPVRGLAKRLSVEVIARTDARPLHYLSRFAAILEEVTREREDAVCGWLAERGIEM